MLYDHQKKIIEEDKKQCGLFLGTGSGKTRTALCLARGYKVLIIAPKTQVEDRNWEREGLNLDGIDPTLHAMRVHVISKETFRRDHAKLPRYDTVIVDECHTCLGVTPNIRYKNRQPIPKTSQLFEALEAYKLRTKPERFYLCTATIIKSPMTVWGAGKLLGMSWDFYKWRDTFYVKLPMVGRDVYAPKRDDATKDHLARIVKSIGYTGQLSDYFDVPEQTFITKYVELSTKQKQRIKELPLEYPDPIVLIGKKHQVENGCLSGDEFNGAEEFDNEKLEKIVEYSDEFPRMVVFAKYKAQIAQIAHRLQKEGKKVLLLTGDTKDRGKVILEANNSKECVFIAQAQVSSGWELPDYPVMIFASMDWSFVSYEQGKGRILRANKLKKNLYIHLIVKNGIDEHVYKTIMNKQDFHLAIYNKDMVE
jgi:superfamily II DNA or RNA helicase